MMSTMCTMRRSPGSAPWTATGPVSGWTWLRFSEPPRKVGIASAAVEVGVICPSKASRVSMMTVSPGLTVITGLIAGWKRLWQAGSSAQRAPVRRILNVSAAATLSRPKNITAARDMKWNQFRIIASSKFDNATGESETRRVPGGCQGRDENETGALKPGLAKRLDHVIDIVRIAIEPGCRPPLQTHLRRALPNLRDDRACLRALPEAHQCRGKPHMPQQNLRTTADALT